VLDRVGRAETDVPAPRFGVDIPTTCAESGTRFEFECYDTAHLYNLKSFLDRGLVRPPLFVQTVFGLQVRIGAQRTRARGRHAGRGPRHPRPERRGQGGVRGRSTDQRRSPERRNMHLRQLKARAMPIYALDDYTPGLPAERFWIALDAHAIGRVRLATDVGN
jgi:hypothetical protein